MQVGWCGEYTVHCLDQELEPSWFILWEFWPRDLTGWCILPSRPSTLLVDGYDSFCGAPPPPQRRSLPEPAAVSLSLLGLIVPRSCMTTEPRLTYCNCAHQDAVPRHSFYLSDCLRACHFLPVRTLMPAEETLLSFESLWSSTSLALATFNSTVRPLKGSCRNWVMLPSNLSTVETGNSHISSGHRSLCRMPCWEIHDLNFLGSPPLFTV